MVASSAMLKRDQHFGGAMLQRLEAADGGAELLSGLEIIDRRLVHSRHRADGLGGERRHRCVRDALDQRECGAGFADHGIGADFHAGERHFGGALTVDGVIAASRNAGRRGIDNKQSDAVLLALAAADARRNDKALCAVAVQHQTFGAVEHVTRSFAARRGGDIGEIVTRLPFTVRERQDQIAGGDLRNKFAAQRFARAKPQQTAAQHHGGEIGFKRQRPPDRLHHNHGLDRPAAQSAVLLGKRQPEQTKLGVLAP
jgi:hypothetical protein